MNQVTVPKQMIEAKIKPGSSIQTMRTWIIRHLVGLNKRALDGELHYTDMAELLNWQLLDHAPDPDELDHDEVIQMLVLLSFIGSSVERHAQQQFVKQELDTIVPEYAQRAAAIQPGRGISALWVNQTTPFSAYFQHLADLIGHPHRDTVMTLTELNGPPVEVSYPLTKNIIYTSHVAFTDNQMLTFSDNITEVNFYHLVRTTTALQIAANEYLDQLQQPDLSLDSPEAHMAAITARQLMLSIKAYMLDFMKHKTFDTDFFLDIFRQYQCYWYPNHRLKPPSAANDPAALHRDLILFDNLVPAHGRFPGFRQHAREVFSVLMPEQTAQLQAAMALPSLETKLLASLGIGGDDLARLDETDLRALVTRQPWLLTYLQLYNAQRDVSRTHYALVAKYIIRPKKVRTETADPRENVTVVDNAYGVTGMDPMNIMLHLNQAREQHPLAWLNGNPVVKRLLKTEPFYSFELSQESLLDLVRVARQE